MKNKFDQKADFMPKDAKALALFNRELELGNFEDFGDILLPIFPRYLVTYMKSRNSGKVRSATVVTVTNQSNFTNWVTVSFFRGASDNSTPVGVCTLSIPPQRTMDFCTRNLPSALTTVNCSPIDKLDFDEGRAIVSSRSPEIGVSARVYYTSGENDEQLLAITDSKIVVYGKQNQGD